MELKVPTIASTRTLTDEDNRLFERAICLIKPNATSKSEAIISIVKNSGLMLLKKRRMHLKPEQVRDFYFRSLDEEMNKYYRVYEELIASEGGKQKLPDIRAVSVQNTVESSKLEEYVAFMTSGPIEVYIVAGRGTISRLQRLIGPEDPKLARITNPNSIRARFGGESILRNAVYGSTDSDQAEQEINYFFPSEKNIKQKNTNEGASSDYLSQTVNPTLLKGLMQLCRQKPDNPLVWLADWLLANNPNSTKT
ncbi:nucleoside diphosphate kinase homolog 5 [Parasteatoda tepidariorum]|uniref:nucleoside diphosphate kinase homolog 5 n=1 Tax=Parasteatoda tepidariorum TaxID=114398 RepID=UPI00077F97C4|nr:nucleoside diphosphate kinase homolog 5 [Parasteatoda tepidariorum]